MRTFLAALIVLGFCLPTIALAEDRIARGQEAEDILIKGKIIDRTIESNRFYYLVMLKGDVWWCQFMTYITPDRTVFRCRTAN